MLEIKFLLVSILSAITLIHYHRSRYPLIFRQQYPCIHRHESLDWHRRLDWRRQLSDFHGGMQILISTWQKFAPKSFPRDPADATKKQQIFVTFRIWEANGRVWGRGLIGDQWPNSAMECGLR